MSSVMIKVNDSQNFIMSDDSWLNTFDAITDLVSVLDKDFRLIKVNRALAEFLQKKPEDLVGKHCYEVMHDRSSHWDGCPHEVMMREKRPITMEVDDPFIGIPLLVTASPIFDDTGELIGSVHVAKDISQIKKIQKDLTIRNQQMEALNKLCREAINSKDVSGVVSMALDKIMTACAPDLALCYTRSGDFLTLLGAVPMSNEYRNKKEKVGGCLCGIAAEKGISVFSEDIHKDGRCTEQECKKAGIRSFAALPLMQDGIIVGVLGIASRSPRNFDAEKEFLEILASTVGVVLQNAFLIEKIRGQSDMLEEKVRARTLELEERNAELQRFNKLFVDREFRIKELRDQIKDLEFEKAKQHG